MTHGPGQASSKMAAGLLRPHIGRTQRNPIEHMRRTGRQRTFVAKPALGTKRICSGCEAKFYDLGKDPIVCPTCETVYVVPKPEPPRGGRGSAPRRSYDPQVQTATSM